MSERTHTPDRVTVDADGRKTTMFKLQRACNGCGQLLCDLDNRDVTEHGGTTDVRAECQHCRPLVEAEAAGCQTWRLTERSYSRVARQIDQLKPWVFTKGYWQTVDGELQIVGLRVGQYPGHVVAYFGDWIIRHPDGRWSVHTAPAAGTEGTA